nr:response regulator transcription factor [Lachnospiraceae bacterium]
MSARILLVEDDDQIREVISDYFSAKSQGCITIITAGDGDTGLDLIMNDDFDLIMLDVMLPGIDGFTLCRRIRSKKDVPLLFLTARVSEDDKLYGYELGCDDYITKPFSLAELYAKVNALLKR